MILGTINGALLHSPSPETCTNIIYHSHFHLLQNICTICGKSFDCQDQGNYGRSLLDGVSAMSTRPRTSALRMPSTHPAFMDANHR